MDKNTYTALIRIKYLPEGDSEVEEVDVTAPSTNEARAKVTFLMQHMYGADDREVTLVQLNRRYGTFFG